jgi:hypothetical protein
MERRGFLISHYFPLGDAFSRFIWRLRRAEAFAH